MALRHEDDGESVQVAYERKLEVCCEASLDYLEGSG